MVNVCRKQGAGTDRHEDPYRYDDDGNDDRACPFGLLAPADLGGVGKFTAFSEQLRRCKFLKKSNPQEQNHEVVQKPDHRDEVWNELNRAH